MSGAVWRDATELEKAAMFALTKCRFAPATAVKRFARSMGAELDRPHRTQPDGTPWPLSGITDRQAALLWKYCHHYRKQITDPYVLEEAEKRWTEAMGEQERE